MVKFTKLKVIKNLFCITPGTCGLLARLRSFFPAYVMYPGSVHSEAECCLLICVRPCCTVRVSGMLAQ